MKRKLIKHGESSLTISLPRSFVKTNNLQKGQEIDVQELDDGLFVSTKNQKEKTTISIDISNQKPVIKKILGAIYKTGYDEINIHFSSFEELRKIKEIVQRQFEGYKIMHQGKNNLLIKKLSADNFEEFNNVLRRFFLIMNNMGLEMTEAIKKTDYDWLKRISLLKIEVDGLADYCRRAINLKFNSDYKRMSPLYVIIEEMEKDEKLIDRLLNLTLRQLLLCIAPGGFYAGTEDFENENIKIKAGVLRRTLNPGDINWLQIPPPNGKGMDMVQWLEGKEEQKTGITKTVEGDIANIPASEKAFALGISREAGLKRLSLPLKSSATRLVFRSKILCLFGWSRYSKVISFISFSP